MQPGPDSVDYYLQCSRLCRLQSDATAEIAYADSALLLLNRLEAREDDPKRMMYFALAHAAKRQGDTALAYAMRSVELLPTSRDAFDALFLAIDFAEILVIFGQHQQAVDQLQQLQSLPGFVSASYLRLDPLWTKLRGSADFQKLLIEGDGASH
jgi:hypothetical protein